MLLPQYFRCPLLNESVHKRTAIVYHYLLKCCDTVRFVIYDFWPELRVS
jgi:hypothetical protein